MTNIFRHERTAFVLFVVATIIIFSGIGLRDAWPPDEPRFALVAKEMVTSGQWLIPMRGGELYPDKPPVFMWSIAVFYLLTGSLSVAMLLPNAIASLITLTVTYRLSRALADERAAIMSMLLLLLSPQFLIQAKFAQIDALVACCVWIGVYGFVRHFCIAESWRCYFIAWGAMGLGIITKGVGFLPLFILVPLSFLAIKKQLPTTRWKKRALLGPLIMLSIVLAWLGPVLYLGAYKQDPIIQQYLSNILLKQTAQRYANAWHHIEPWYYYIIEVIPLFWFPSLMVLAVKRKQIKRVLMKNPAYFALAIWVVLVVVFFSFSPGKRGVYILPSLPAVAMIAGLLLSRGGVSKTISVFARSVTLLISLGAIAAAAVLMFNEQTVSALMLRFHSTLSMITTLGAICFLVGIMGLSTQFLNFSKHLILWLVVTTVVPSTIGVWVLNDLRTPTQLLMRVQTQSNIISPDINILDVGIVSFKEQYLLFAPFPVTHFGYHTEKDRENGTAWTWLKAQPTRFLLAPKDYLFQCVDLDRAVSLGFAHRDEWLLIPSTAADVECKLLSDGPIYRS
ncbi:MULTISPECIES: ArnT family glycosyltransferase [Alteromonas]|uniref:Glycosyltransferase family 39 protein n=1 Tax=Alteromonas stellipolaris TaxID=233316 RepID=A0AAW7YY94_9ALTE|nr:MULTISPECIES: glycosyltransferase family 39 protein [Alteromonas]AMJ91233.1 glycosyl transferase [Alteromonas sp. Mac2]AMJ87371.1 glycosyl transferase [Alteromonas sp. Mac1]ANB21922.1 glycosyl transferase [Alteromonas stellipolaris]MDO6577369.1 glycosyltransferase family 39 protein [Alteromonas stellipolaris]MDP2537327.1 glycosyltransferase family 39 protein [Alteromonas stellipolaris]